MLMRVEDSSMFVHVEVRSEVTGQSCRRWSVLVQGILIGFIIWIIDNAYSFVSHVRSRC